MPAVKALVAHVRGDPAWSLTRPPFVPLRTDEARALAAAFDRLFRAEAA
jgi:dihydrodipicolinate synthase/N-acetylneuraminate lyase